jgi:hypothetical protein
MGQVRDDPPDFSKTLAACDRNLPAGACLDWHIRPHLAKTEVYRGDPAKGFGTGYSAQCPAHDDGHASFTVSIGLRCIWYQCHAGCDQLAVRTALIRRGVPAACLPVPRERKSELVDELARVLTTGDMEDGHKVLLALALVRGMGELPRGGKLEDLAAETGTVSRPSAYRYRRAGGQDPTSGRYPSKQEPAQNPRSARRVAPAEKSHGETLSHRETSETTAAAPKSLTVRPPGESQLSPDKPRRRRAA